MRSAFRLGAGLVGGYCTGKAYYAVSAQTVAGNPQPFTGYWSLPDGTNWWLKQWESRVTGCVEGSVAGNVANTSSGKIEISEDGNSAVVNGVPLERLRPNVVVICGPSGVGKGTLLGKLLKDHSDSFGFSVSHTSRGPRPGEVDGKDYHFSTKEEMKKMIEAGDFVEYAEVHGNYYGTSKASVADVHKEGKICLLDIDVQGAQKVQKAGIPFVGLFIKPPSAEELERRLRGRGTETEEKIQKRLKNALGEIAFCDSHSFYWYELVNKDLEVCYKEFLQAIGQSTQCTALEKVSFADNAAPQTGVFA
eukprot:TRINITY_DN5067_c0_g2_i3.p1 TRINITY_DN5067_c0_g2~~TRINITY_DN5067_c0_g2_i3.p1  ORF type:complete len:306 (+),score=146.77 TRINITY_DN5067_c0_g2_i3:70-987(+)